MAIVILDSTIGISVNGWLLENPIPFVEGFDSAEYFPALTDFEWFWQLKLNDRNVKCFLLFGFVMLELTKYKDMISKRNLENRCLQWELARDNFDVATDTLATMLNTYKCNTGELLNAL